MSGTGAPARVLLVVVAVLAVAWLAVGLRDSRKLAEAARIAAEPKPPPERIDRGLRLVADATLLNPDAGEPGILRAALHFRAGRPDAAQRAMEAVVRREPEDAGAWVILADFTRASDPRRSAQALARARALNPLGVARRR